MTFSKKAAGLWDYGMVFFLLVVMFSLLENLTHRFLMHKIIPLPFLHTMGKHHMAHHRTMMPDNQCMDLNQKCSEHQDLLRDDKEMNLCLHASTLVLFLLGGGLVWLGVHLFYPRTISSLLLLGMIGVIAAYCILTWNTIHPFLHRQKTCAWLGLPGTWWLRVPWFRTLIFHHIGHHYYKKDEKKNYNVTLPLADHLFGTVNSLPPDLHQSWSEYLEFSSRQESLDLCFLNKPLFFPPPQKK